MQAHLFQKDELVTNIWAGGTTTQLFIYPENASYKNQDFIFRISTATIDAEDSVFSHLPGVHRTLMLLEGELAIWHKEKYDRRLKKFDTDIFMGDWETTSIGKAVDFNIMTRGITAGFAEGFSMQENQRKELVLESDFMLLYVYTGEIKAEKTVATGGSVLFFTKENAGEKIIIQTRHSSDVAIAKIYLSGKK